MSLITDMQGQRFGMLRPLRSTDNRIDGAVVWECLCDCGNTCMRSRRHLRNGSTTSCGCKRARILRGEFKITHGMSHTRTWRIWAGIRRRCFDPRDTSYQNYGARGITMCDRWRKSFENFFADMGTCPDGLEIDRIEVNGHYEPGNCRWIDEIGQQNNRRNNHKIGTKTLTQASREAGIRPGTVLERLRRGWTPEEALS